MQTCRAAAGAVTLAPFAQLSTVTALASPGFAFLATWQRAAELAGPPLKYGHSHPRGVPGTADRLGHAGMNGKDIDQARKGKNPQHLLLRRGQQQLTTGVPGLPPPPHERGHPAGVDELQACQVDDDIALAGRDRSERSRDAHGVCYVKHPAQRDDHLTVAFAGTQIHADQWDAFLLRQQGGVWARRLIRQLHNEHYAEGRRCPIWRWPLAAVPALLSQAPAPAVPAAAGLRWERRASFTRRLVPWGRR
jgi:hypothetical protein